jgi:hypothetical protein
MLHLGPSAAANSLKASRSEGVPDNPGKAASAVNGKGSNVWYIGLSVESRIEVAYERVRKNG